MFAFILIGLYLSSFYNYLLFHTLIELFSIVVAISIFVIAWNTKKFLKNKFLFIIGMGFLFIGLLDLLHTLAYEGMDLFPQFTTNLPTQLWIAARYFEVFVLLLVSLFPNWINNLKENAIIIGFSLVFVLLGSSIFFTDIFPACYIPDMGLTTFKIVSEYVIIILLIAVIYLQIKRKILDYKIRKLVIISLLFTIFSELAFTFYVDVYGLSNLIGHYFKIFSFFFIYRALIAKGLNEPYSLIFKDLQQKKEELEKANKSKDKFFSIISHDLKGPFSALVNITDILIKDSDDFDQKEMQHYLKVINKSSKSTYNLLLNLLQWSRAQTNRLHFRPQQLKLDKYIKENIDIYKSMAVKKDISIEFSGKGLSVYADVNVLNTVLRNLLSNAMKFTYFHGKIKITTQQYGNDVKIKVTDSGKGIKEENIDKIFKIDEQFTTKGTESETGTGLGLILVKELLKKNEGKIWVTSTEGEGSTFSFTLPTEDWTHIPNFLRKDDDFKS